MTIPEYNSLKQDIVYSVGVSDYHTHFFNKLKEFYKDDIDSERRYEQINSIGQLLEILQIRQVLSEDNVGPMKEIARMINNNELLNSICEYEANHIPKDYVNQYVIENIPLATISENKETGQSNLTVGLLNANKIHRIRETLGEEIGNYWRDLGRNLKINECKIDKIDCKYNKLENKAAELINIFLERADKQRWFFELCEALEKSRRKDLSRKLQEIMTMNI